MGLTGGPVCLSRKKACSKGRNSLRSDDRGEAEETK